ncbi:MAG: transcription-repair coupling factor [Clostridiales bacterium]|nr:transcription-repair coupling factor [Clostridiales bacterium]
MNNVSKGKIEEGQRAGLFYAPVAASGEYKGFLSNLYTQLRSPKPLPMLVSGLCDGARTAFYLALASELREKFGRGFLAVVPEEKDALRISNAFADCGMKALIYPMRDFVYRNMVSSHEYEHERIAALDAVVRDDYDIVLTTPDAAVQYTMPRSALAASTAVVSVDGENSVWDIEKLTEYLVGAGYVRTDMVDGVGGFSVRGGIVDIWPPHAPNPVRIDFFGDEIEQMSVFDMMTQRTIEKIDRVYLTPAREIMITKEKRAELAKALSAQLAYIDKAAISSEKLSAEVKIAARKSAQNELEALNSGLDINFGDKYINLIYDERVCLLDYFDGNIIAVQEKNAVSERLKGFAWHQEQQIKELLAEYSVDAKYAEYSLSVDDFNYRILNSPSFFVDNFTSGAGMKLSGIYSFNTRQTPSYSGKPELLLEDLAGLSAAGREVLLMTESETAAKAAKNLLDDKDIPCVINTKDEFIPGLPNIIYGVNIGGFEILSSNFASLSLYANPNSLSRVSSAKKKRPGKKSARERIMSYADLSQGDLVVHVTHGIGRYIGLDTLTMDGVTRDYMKIQYAGTDKLYLPCDQLDMVSKYIGTGGDDSLAKLSRMGGTDWTKAKNKAKGAAKEMAKQLIKLYAERMKLPGFAFYPDDDMQLQFESAFEYEETEGQLEASREIKADMEKKYPMDRLLCGDVGFGKTEVALRAAFKAVSSGKQVVLLVPTTILAMQHYQTILSRMRGYPVTAEMLSRFRTAKQQAEIVRRVRRGEIDILVGTHRVLSKDIEFKNLGLVIVDEEQRFGVAQKEKLKQLTRNVDVLTLTATPIPRTLNMAMSGIRDMSILEEAPGDRLPVQTYVLEYDDGIIAEALKKELRRGGQVFYLHNRVETIYETAARVKILCPEARVVTAHGKMEKEELSDIWQAMVEGEVDILVSTTIIETGVDVPNANTLVIEHADDMGLSQLHQIRGRVGRSSRRAYAYLTFSRGKVLTEIAAKRLSAIRDYTEFGSGFKIAMRDLEIRGAGNLLGAEQHGHISSVGYDLYMKILNEAILEEKGAVVEEKKECAVNIKVTAYIPESYIQNSNQRIDAYKKISGIENEEDFSDITDELLDRWGNLPTEVSNLLQISLIRGLGTKSGMEKISWEGVNITFLPYKAEIAVWTELASDSRNKGRILMNVGVKPYIQFRMKRGEDVLEMTLLTLKRYLKIAAGKASGGKTEAAK